MIFRKIKGVTLPGYREMSLNGGIKENLKPEVVYLPLTNGNSPYRALVEVGQTVLKGQAVVQREDRFGHPIHSPVSGTVTAIKKAWHPSGKTLDSLEITNDFQEKWVESYGTAINPNFTKEEGIARLKECGIVGLGGAGFPTWAKYQTNVKINTLIVNAVECEPYITCDDTVLENYADKFVRGIKYALKLSGATTCKIAIKSYKKKLIAHLAKAIQNTPEINLLQLRNVYPAGWERYIVENATGQKYETLPSELGVIVNNVQTIIAICDAFELNKPLIERFVTVTGEFKNPCNVNTKIGVKLTDLVVAAGGFLDSVPEGLLVIGGPMTGRALYSDETYTLPQTGAVLSLAIGQGIEQACLGCGKCAENCPAFLTPTEIIRAHEADEAGELEKLNVLKCVQCGLCSYVCPSKINLTDNVAKAMDYLRKNRAANKKG